MRLLPRRHHPLRRAIRATGRECIRFLGLKRRREPTWEVAPGRGTKGQVVYVSGEPGTPGHAYRVERYARAARDLGHPVAIVSLGDLTPAWRRAHAPHPAAVVIWRAPWCGPLEQAVAEWRHAGSRILFDVDDYMFDPGIARAEIIDGIRSQRIPERDVVVHYDRIRTTLSWSDEALAPTERLADGMQAVGKPAIVLPNGFDEETYRASREAVLRRRREPPDGLVRIGYAAGTRTHQRDFAVAAAAVADVLRRHPEARLVLFRTADGRDTLDPAEFPELDGVRGQIEWRTTVPLDRLPDELARFDVNLAPLEVGNVYCEAKSQLKYFEAALVDVPTLASPTQPYRDAIRHGETGFLATGPDAWREHLGALACDPTLRARVGRSALWDVLHRYGPDGRRQRLAAALGRVLGTPAERTAAFGAELVQQGRGPLVPSVPGVETLQATGGDRIGRVAVVIPVYNYGRFVVEALDSVAAQTLPDIELVVVDDCSTDGSVAVVRDWLHRHAARFVSATLLGQQRNRGLASTRNAGFDRAEAPLVFPLDADNVLEPDCLRLLAERLEASPAAAAHPTLQRFGDCDYRHVAQAWSPDRLRRGNYIDAMALIRKSAWAHVGGYSSGGFVGWEDYELWCKFVEAGLWSDGVPEAVARYRVHGGSMLSTTTNTAGTLPRVIAAIESAHPWLRVRAA